MPCKLRPTIKNSTFGASAHASDAKAKTAIPPAKMIRRPKMSPSEPPINIKDERKSE
jgi:hypothetical protein